MNNDPRLIEALNLLKAFDDQLAALNSGRRLNKTWQRKLLGEFKRQWPGKPGKLPNYKKIEEVVTELSLVGGEIRESRTKRHNPADYKEPIETKLGVNRRCIDRVAQHLPVFLDELDPMLSALPKAKRKAYLDGLAEAISRNIDADDAPSEAAERAERRRKWR